jgi:GDP-4-dehydro-6-deoxy-D-mannose reductase
VLVTGAAGFVGGWVVPALRETGRRVVSLYKPEDPPRRFEGEWEPVDLRDAAQVEDRVARLRPRAVLHLAAIAVPRHAEADPAEALRVNLGAVDHLLRALSRRAPEARLLLVSSGAVYGRRAADAPRARESDPLRPDSFYASTKAAAERRAERAVSREGLDVVRVRPFNHTGPGRPASYAETSFAEQIAEIIAGRREPAVHAGNLDAIRDFSDVRDVVAAYLLLLERGERGEVYNVCSGQGRTLRSVLETMIAAAQRPIRIAIDPERYEPAAPDAVALVGDPARLRALGWTPRFPVERTFLELVDAAAERLRAAS